ncbi:MAG: hypothetical protein AAGA12_01035 [Pseudomonadota bacterium]
MPAGSVLAKGSFSIKNRKSIGRIGPIFIMAKAEAGRVPDTPNRLYSTVQPIGKPLKIKESACHDCHAAFEDRDILTYPFGRGLGPHLI